MSRISTPCAEILATRISCDGLAFLLSPQALLGARREVVSELLRPQETVVAWTTHSPNWQRQIAVCHPVEVSSNSSNPAAPQAALLVLGIDTCGPAGSVALGRLTGDEVEILSQIELEGRTYSATLVAAVSEVLTRYKVAIRDVGCLVVVNGPGSFTGVRVGLSAAKGLSEGADIPVIAVSRLEVLASKAGIADTALDAHRHEVFLRAGGRELLAGVADLADLSPVAEIAVCDPAARELIATGWPAANVSTVTAPTASDALILAAPLIHARRFADIALLDGHYLRRSDAEIFGDPAAATPARRA